MREISPFLHRDERSVHEAGDVERAQQTYAERCVPTPEFQRAKIECFRYRDYERRGRLGRFMQRLGDFGREFFPFIGRGWDGFGPNK